MASALPKDLNILVVDDAMIARRYVKQCLAQMGYAAVQEADNGASALKILRDSYAAKRPIELVISDWRMPDVDGMALLAQIAKDPAIAGTPFVFVTATPLGDKVKECMKAGALGFLEKPFSLEQLRQTLEASLIKRAS